MATAKSKLNALRKLADKKFNADAHPRYPKGHPMGGQFMPKTSTSSMRSSPEPSYINVGVLSKRRSILESVYGKEYVEKCELHLQSLLDKASVLIRVPSNKVLGLIAKDGGYKTRFETGTGIDSIEDFEQNRANDEEILFGYKQNMPPRDRPAYGYYAEDPFYGSDGELGDGYGDIVLKLSGLTKENSTFTARDTINAEVQPSQSSNVSIASFFVEKHFDWMQDEKYRHIGKNSLDNLLESPSIDDVTQPSGYFEAQIHKQVKSSDIAEIIYTQPGSTVPKSISKWASSLNIKITQK